MLDPHIIMYRDIRMPVHPLRLVTVSDIHGNWDALDDIAAVHKPLAIIHTGNFGFWDSGTVKRAVDVSYLKQIVAFLHVLPRAEVMVLNDFSTISSSQKIEPSDGGDKISPTVTDFREALLERSIISHMDKYISGDKQLPCPVYTIVGPLDDPEIVERFMSGTANVPNLHLISHDRAYTLKVLVDGPAIHLYGLGGNLKVHSLFDNGSLKGNVVGKPGDLWITLAQVAEFFLQHQKLNLELNAVKIFISHSPVIKTPLLEHLAIITGADITVSQGLHFKYPVLGNGMSFVDSMGGSAGYIENYRSKFSRLRMILGELWLVIKNDVNRMLADDPEMRNLIELGLSLFDKIPVTVNDSTEKILRLTLANTNEDDADELEISKLSVKKINDMYFSAYYNLWHFNLCDYLIDSDEEDSEEENESPAYNVMVFCLNRKGKFRLEHCNSQGFNFKVLGALPDSGLRTRNDEGGSDEGSKPEDPQRANGSPFSTNTSQNWSAGDDSIKESKGLINSPYNRSRVRSRGRLRGGQGRKRGRPSV